MSRAAAEPRWDAPVTLNQNTHGGNKTVTKPKNLAPISQNSQNKPQTQLPTPIQFLSNQPSIYLLL